MCSSDLYVREFAEAGALYSYGDNRREMMRLAHEHCFADPAVTAVVIDPPRKGCDESFLHQLLAFGPRAVVYVSCDPATLARDLAELSEYRIEALSMFDLFPQTYHLETVARLVRQG